MARIKIEELKRPEVELGKKDMKSIFGGALITTAPTNFTSIPTFTAPDAKLVNDFSNPYGDVAAEVGVTIKW